MSSTLPHTGEVFRGAVVIATVMVLIAGYNCLRIEAPVYPLALSAPLSIVASETVALLLTAYAVRHMPPVRGWLWTLGMVTAAAAATVLFWAIFLVWYFER